MPSILFLTPELPYPPFSGGRIKSWKLVEFLGAHYSLGLACALKGDDETYLPDFRQRARLTEFIGEPVKIPRSARALMGSYVQRIPLNVFRTRSTALRQRIAAIAPRHDLIFCDHYEVFQYVPDDYRGRVVLHEHNAYFLMWRRYAQTGNNPVMRLASYLEYRRVRRYELHACARANLIFASPNDIDSLVEAGADRSKCRVTYHLGDEFTLNQPPLDYDATEPVLLYVGTLTWEANIDGLQWFLAEVWPAVKRRHPRARFRIAGKNPDARLVRAAVGDPAVEFLGFVEDLEPLFRSSRVFVAPLRFGAGIKVKVLSGMGRGIPTVTTSVGSEGLQVQHLRHAAITDQAPDMVTAIDTLLTDRQLWETLSRESRALVESQYTWDRVLGSMQQELQTLLTASGR
ncbi:MAG: glycosyltransferase [Candidatus Contendobacter sp.]|nr:glycosyltransferase [Candidatus Contendobacter sp.]